MNDAEQPSGRMRQWVGRVAPGAHALSRYQPAWLPNDIAAGLSVAAVALPVGIAYADLAGVPARAVVVTAVDRVGWKARAPAPRLDGARDGSVRYRPGHRRRRHLHGCRGI